MLYMYVCVSFRLQQQQPLSRAPVGKFTFSFEIFQSHKRPSFTLFFLSPQSPTDAQGSGALVATRIRTRTTVAMVNLNFLLWGGKFFCAEKNELSHQLEFVVRLRAFLCWTWTSGYVCGWKSGVDWGVRILRTISERELSVTGMQVSLNIMIEISLKS